jgi:HD-like signal output (HDOD) protein
MDEFHCELGAKLAQNWRLGPWIDTAARYHHHPELAPTLKREAELTGLADLLAHWAVDRPEQELSPDEPQARARFLREGDLAILQRRRERVLNGAEAYL